LRRCQKIVSDGEEVRCVGKLFHRLAAKTGKARLPTVARLKDGIVIVIISTTKSYSGL